MYAIVYGRMGTDAMAAMTITQTIEQIIFVVSVGVGNASAVMLGNSLGAMEGDKIYDEAVQFVKSTSCWAHLWELLLYFQRHILLEYIVFHL